MQGSDLSSPFSLDAAIKKQLDKVPDDHSLAVVITGEKREGQNATARLAMVLKGADGRWAVKTYAEVEQGHKPTIGAELIFSR